MFASSNNHRSVSMTFVFKNLQKDEIMQNDLNQSKNSRRIEIIRIETNSSFDELKKNFDALKIFMLNLNERFEKTKRQLQDRLKLQKFKKFKTKIRILKRKDSETYASEWFGSVRFLSSENRTDVGLIFCRIDFGSV
jgi:hypothetical protein